MKLNRKIAFTAVIALAATVFCSQATADGYKCATCGKSFASMQAALGHKCKNNGGGYQSSPYPNRQTNSYSQQNTTKTTQKKTNTAKQTTAKQTTAKQTTAKQTTAKQTTTTTTAAQGKTYKEFEAQVTMQKVIKSHYKPTLGLASGNTQAEFIFLTQIKAGQTKTVKVKLTTAKAVKKGDTFTILDGGKKVGTGKITSL